MAGVIKGRLLCGTSGSALSDASADGRATRRQEFYKTTYDFMTDLQSAGYVDLIALNHGIVGGDPALAGTNYWDQALPFGTGSFSVWRWNTSSTRNWEWYMMLQYHEVNAGTVTQGEGLVMLNRKTIANQTYGTGISVGIAVDANDQTVNPWNGTMNADGSDVVGNPVWTTGSGDRVFVFPCSNTSSSFVNFSNDAQRDRAFNGKADQAPLFLNNFTGDLANAPSYFYLVADEDSFGCAVDHNLDSTGISLNSHSFLFAGPYRPIGELSSSIKIPFLLNYNNANEDATSPGGGFLSTRKTSTETTQEPHASYYGILGPLFYDGLVSSSFIIKKRGSVVRPMYMKYHNISLFSPNLQLQAVTGKESYDEMPVFIYQDPYPRGIIGMFESNIVKCLASQSSSWHISNSGSTEPGYARLKIRDSDTVFNGDSIGLYWAGSFLPGTGSFSEPWQAPRGGAFIF